MIWTQIPSDSERDPNHGRNSLFFVLSIILVYLGLSIYFWVSKSDSSLYIWGFISVVSMILGFIAVRIKRSNYRCDDKAIDMWSIAHIVVPIWIFIILNTYFSISVFYSILIVAFLKISNELIEVLAWKILYNYACESMLNHVIDLVFGIGAVLLYAFFL